MYDGIYNPCAMQPWHLCARSGPFANMQGLPGRRVPGRKRRDGMRAVRRRQLLPGRLVSRAAVPGRHVLEQHWPDKAERVHQLPRGLVVLDGLARPHAVCAGDGGAKREEPELH